ncbi:hypothetical protein [Bdellovibrio reynosensis]|uniref:FCP1 homology domain-containing protein n=1 Tax=Bdellovibrio reynosensis TaxID=2835041 RepID=A0ABY4CGE0_9BACT|nr:hypothetical protein [Bdellovibrio reynosensis]UOF01270.1 hypothetical protein MNR06_16365 [Bdellovibrio reynosensis]
MKIKACFSFLISALLITMASVAFASPTAPIDIVFDIDWTTFYTAHPDKPNQGDDKVIIVEGKAYRPTDHLGEVLEKISSRPDVRISFFSGGERSRNETLLKAFKLPSGRSAYDIAYKVLSKENLTTVSEDASLGFSERYKKSMAGILPGATAERTILVDDQVNFSVKPWKAVASLGVFNFQKEFDASKANEAYFPKSKEEWRAERDKALMWQALLEEALSSSNAHKKQSFAQIAEDLWAQKSHRGLCKNIFAD